MRTMSTRTAGWVAGAVAATAVALRAAAAMLTYLDRHRLPADLNNWSFPGSVFTDVTYLASIVVGFVLANLGLYRGFSTMTAQLCGGRRTSTGRVAIRSSWCGWQISIRLARVSQVAEASRDRSP